jgi:histone H1/5
MTTFGSALMLLVALSGCSLQADAALDQAKLKRPLSPYFAWLKESRKGIKGKNIAEIAKKAGEMWKSLPADKKKTYEERASKAKTEYAAYIAKVKGTEAFQAYMDQKAAARKKKLARSVRSAMHKVPKDAKLKKPLSGYMVWFKGARSTIKGKNIAEVSKKAGEMWKGLSAEKKKPFADKAQEAKKTYDAYVATSKGAAALKSYKDAIAKARAPLTKNSDAAKAKKAAAKVKAKAKREKAKAKAAAKKGKVQALKEKAKARAAAAKEKVTAMKAAKAEKAKAKVAAKAKAKAAKKVKAKAKAAAKAKAKAAKKDKAKAKAAAKAKAKAAKKETAKAKAAAMKAVMKKAKAMKAPMKASMKTKKIVKKLAETTPDLVSILATMLVGALSCGAIALAVLNSRRSVSSPSEEPLLV